MLGIDLCTTQVNEVKIDPVDVRSSKVYSHEIRLADLLGALEILFVVVIAIETRTASLTGDGAAD